MLDKSLNLAETNKALEALRSNNLEAAVKTELTRLILNLSTLGALGIVRNPF
jgi:hypothetical protein